MPHYAIDVLGWLVDAVDAVRMVTMPNHWWPWQSSGPGNLLCMDRVDKIQDFLSTWQIASGNTIAINVSLVHMVIYRRIMFHWLLKTTLLTGKRLLLLVKTFTLFRGASV